MQFPLISVVRFKDKVIIPTQSWTTSSYHLETDPVAVHDVADAEGVVRTLLAQLAQGHPEIPTPSRDNWPKSVLLAATKVKSIAALEKQSAIFTATAGDRVNWRIYPSKHNAKGRWEADLEKMESMPLSVPAEQMARRLVALCQRMTLSA